MQQVVCFRQVTEQSGPKGPFGIEATEPAKRTTWKRSPDQPPEEKLAAILEFAAGIIGSRSAKGQ